MSKKEQLMTEVGELLANNYDPEELSITDAIDITSVLGQLIILVLDAKGMGDMKQSLGEYVFEIRKANEEEIQGQATTNSEVKE